MNFENFDGVSPTSGNRGNTTQDIYIYGMNLTILARPQKATRRT